MTTEKMLPAGMMPGKDEIEKYKQLYLEPDFTLAERISSFDTYSLLPEAYILTFCSRYPAGADAVVPVYGLAV